ncbi:MAG: glycosyltransferase [bacterium]|nr:glycosyltransferase [bacterium]
MGVQNQDNTGRPKKVLFLITKATWGGAQRYVYDLAMHLDRKEFQPLVAYGTAGKLSDDLEKAGIKTYLIRSLGRDIALISDIASFFQIIRCIQNLRPDVLHLNSSKAAALGALAGRLCGVQRIIFTVHGWPFKEDRNILVRGLIRLISWFTATLSHSVIVVSKEDKALGERMWINQEKIHYIPLALSQKEMYAREQAAQIIFRKDLEIDAPFINSIRLVTIAELTPNKGLRHAIDMMEELKQRSPRRYTYTIIGEGEEGSSLSNQVQELGVGKSVRFANFFSNRPPENLSSEGSRYLPAFDVFILPSIKEGMPYVLLEAAAAGLPIIATDVVKAEASSLPNIYFVPSGDGPALAGAVEKLAKNLPVGKPSIVGSFSDMVAKTIALY